MQEAFGHCRLLRFWVRLCPKGVFAPGWPRSAPPHRSTSRDLPRRSICRPCSWREVRPEQPDAEVFVQSGCVSDRPWVEPSVTSRHGSGHEISLWRGKPMRTRRLVIANPRGLHAQACARIADIAKHCHCNLFVVSNGRRVSARDLVAVMLLTATVGSTVRIVADGPDEEVAIREIATLFDDGLGERRSCRLHA
jgi:phosphocarrier protein HPr